MVARDVDRMSADRFDVLVIGGGISGACIAWDATLRGLRVALVERGDFGAATSANSLKTVHGGLRYLQDADLGQVRKMVGERQAFLRIAPHLVRPLPCLMPTYRRRLMRHKAVLGIALRANDLLSLDRNWGMDEARTLPRGRILSREACLAHLAGMDDPEISGGVMWHDAQMHNTERMLWSFILSAVNRGAKIANYVEAKQLLRDGRRVVGALVEDQLTGEQFQLCADVVVNAAGPWADDVVQSLGCGQEEPCFRHSVAMNLVTRQILPDTAVGLTSRYVDEMGSEQSRVLFIAPWEAYSIVGTRHVVYEGDANGPVLDAGEVEDFVEEVNRAFPPARLQSRDVFRVHVGFLPAEDGGENHDDVRLVRKEQLVDHGSEGVEGLVTAVGVKYTTARFLAERTVDLVFAKLGRKSPPCRTRFQRLYGGAILDWQGYREQALRAMTGDLGIASVVATHLLDHYGSAYGEILAYKELDEQLLEPLGLNTRVTGAEVVHAAQCEMAVRLGDVIFRRTPLGAAAMPSEQVVEKCAALVGARLGWDRERMFSELDAFYAERLPSQI